MNKQRNDKNAFNNSLGSVGRLKGRWQNYPTGSPKSQVTGKTMNMKVKKIQPTSPPITEHQKFAIATLRLENRILNFQQNPYPKDPKTRTASYYFRSSIQKRIIGGQVLIATLDNKCITQKEIREITKLTKGIVSKVCSESVEAGWFHCNTVENVPCYTTDELINRSVLEYTHQMWSDTDDPILIEVCRRFDILYLQNKLDADGSRGEPET